MIKKKRIEHSVILTLKQSKHFPGRENAINKRTHDFVPYKMLAAEYCIMTHGVTVNGLCCKHLN